MILNHFGIVSRKELIRTAQIRTYVELDAFIIMPDHVHCIIIINKQNDIKHTGMACHAQLTKNHAQSKSTHAQLSKNHTQSKPTHAKSTPNHDHFIIAKNKHHDIK